MASVFLGGLVCPTGGLEEGSTSGSPSASTTKKSGEYSYLSTGDGSTAHFIYKDIEGTIASGEYRTYLLTCRFSDITPTGSGQFAGMGSSGAGYGAANNDIRLVITTAGTITITASDGTTNSINAATHGMVADEWYMLRVDVYHHATAGKAKLTANGATVEITGADTLTGNQNVIFGAASSLNGVSVYCDVFVAFEDSGVYEPTDLPADIAKTTYQTADADGADLGTTLDSGNWVDAGTLPWNAASSASYTSSGVNGGSACDDGSRTGPSGDSALTGATIFGAVVSINAERGNGGGTTHTLYYGSDGDVGSWPSGMGSKTLTLDTAAAYYEAVFEGALVPTTSEYAVWGFGTSGARDFIAYDATYSVVYEPSASPDADVNVSGVSGTASPGAATVSGEANVSPTGVSATGSAGSVTVAIPVSVSITGVSAAGSVGSVSVTGVANVSPSGVAGTGSPGSVTPSIKQDVSVTGVSGTGSAGATTVTAEADVSPSGVAATGSAGAVTTTGIGNVSPTGVAATASPGAVTVAPKANISVSGIGATGAVGSSTVTADANVSPSGVSATGSPGSVTVTAGGAVDVNVSGVVGTGSAGAATVTGIGNVTASGVAGTGNVGAVTVSTAGAVSVNLSGVSATGSVGSVTTQGEASISITGVTATGGVGATTVTADSAVGWTFDADHFTFDDDTSHKWDGWHVDAVETITTSHGGGWIKEKDDIGELVYLRQIKREDEFLMQLITEFLDKAA